MHVLLYPNCKERADQAAYGSIIAVLFYWFYSEASVGY